MEKLEIVWIWWNEKDPNPRLPSYVIDNIKSKSDILLTSSVDSAIKNCDNKKDKILTEFNTNQKIKFIEDFTKNFYPDRYKNIKKDFSPKTNQIEDKQWLEFWSEIEKNMTSKEKAETSKILEIFNTTWDINKWKIYSARHPFWFKDLSLKWENKSIDWYGNKTTYWWKSEWFFNFIR